MKPIVQFGVAATAVTAGLLAAGLLLTRSSPADTREAMLWACAVAFVGSTAGLLPLVLGAVAPETPEPPETPETAEALGGKAVRGGAGPAAVSRFLASMLVRMAVVAVGSLAVIGLGAVAAKPFLLWLAVGYLALLVVETAFALRVFQSL